MQKHKINQIYIEIHFKISERQKREIKTDLEDVP